ncbi:hypothetical protein [Myxosarcina sp. GI1(2024)]
MELTIPIVKQKLEQHPKKIISRVPLYHNQGREGMIGMSNAAILILKIPREK